MSNEIKDHITSTIRDNPVVLFMKGTADFPMCGFSATVCAILDELEIGFKDINVLEDDDLRQGIKDFSEWPTIPQLYVNGEFIGGCDIVRDMFESGELADLFRECA